MLVSVAVLSALLQVLAFSQCLFKPISTVLALTPSGAMNQPDTSTSELGLSSEGISNELETHWHAPQEPSFLDCPQGADPYGTSLSGQSFPPFDLAKANIYRYRQQQSVNLGSWFVHEEWMTPSLFEFASGNRISELDIASGWGSITSARGVLEQHWDTFIDRSDFQYLTSIGINTVRLPIGYWSLGPHYCQDTPFAAVADVYQNSWSRVVRAINMAGEAGIGVLVDLHGAVGSQNGQPHSGISDGAVNLFSDPSNMDKTVACLDFLMQELVNVTNLVGIQILNEPRNVPELADFYTRAITSMRQASPAAASFPLYLHDGFDLERFSNFVANRTDFVVQDHHSYFVFTPSDEIEPASKHTSDIESSVYDSLSKASAQQHRNLVVDEWSCALTPQSISNEPDPNEARKVFCTKQMEVYTNTTAGWGFWSYQKEGCDNDPDWCFKKAVGNSLPSTFFSYGESIASDPAQLQHLADVVANMDFPSILDTLTSTQRATNGSKAQTSLPIRQSVSSRDLFRYRHRLASIHRRRQGQRDNYDVMNMTDSQRTMTKGYSDGFVTVDIFASYGMSKLGFIEQYIDDSCTALGSSIIAKGTEDIYKDWFIRGLQDGQAIISTVVHP